MSLEISRYCQMRELDGWPWNPRLRYFARDLSYINYCI